MKVDKSMGKQLTKKLRDVQQEREGTSLNYFKVFFNYIEQLPVSWFISVSFSLFLTILVYIRLSQTVSDYL